MVHALDWDAWDALNGTTWYDTWIVVYDNATKGRSLLALPRRAGVVVFGSALAGWVLVVCGLLALALVLRPGARRRPPLHWHVLNFTVAQLLTGTAIVPLMVRTERLGYWGLGGTACRAWLLLQVFLSTLGFWSTLMASVDRFLFALQPFLYIRRMSTRRACGLMVITWLVALATVVPPGVSMIQDPEVVLEEVCAMSMTRHYALGVSLAAFFAPAVLAILATVGALCFSMQDNPRRQPLRTSEAPASSTSASSLVSTTSSTVPTDSPTGSAGTLTAVVVVVVIMWAPFYVVNLMLPWCRGLCVPPGLWSGFLWLGYASTGVAPLIWLCEPTVRRRCMQLLQCSREETTCTTGRAMDAEDQVKLFKSGLDRDSCKEYTM